MTLIPVWTEQIKYVVGIFAILNPLGVIPIYLSLTAGRRSKEMHHTAFKTAVAVAVILMLAVLLRYRHPGISYRRRTTGTDHCNRDV
jgi:hypothetical protein